MTADHMTSSESAESPQRGRGSGIALLVIASCQLMVVLDITIVNIALPHIQTSLGFSTENLSWVINAYTLTFGGLLLLGGRSGDILGRRRMFMFGVLLFVFASLLGGLSQDAWQLLAARSLQGVGGAIASPTALSLITTTFREGPERNRAFGVFAAVSAGGSAIGLLAGGVLVEWLDWRWVFFVNLPVGALILVAIYRLVPADGPARVQRLDVGGALLVTAGMLLLVYTIVEAPDQGWGSGRTIGGFAGAGLLLAAFVLWESRQSDPLFPFSILRIKGLAAADVTQVIAMAGFYSMFFFITLYLQNVLGFSQIQAGLAYVPTTLTVAVGAGLATVLIGRVGTRPVIVAGAVLGAAGIFWLSFIPVNGSYVSDLLPALTVMALGLGGVFVGVTTAAQAGVPEDQAGLAAAMINSSTWLGGALGIAIFSAVATSTTTDLIAGGAGQPAALTGGFQDALLAAAIFLAAAAVIALRSPNTHGAEEPVETVEWVEAA